jgi:3-oxoacyl-[acyl-carrier-protein] synthase II
MRPSNTPRCRDKAPRGISAAEAAGSFVRVFITGIGVVSSIGLGKEAFFAALQAGQSGISPVEAFDTSSLGRTFAGEVKGFRPQDHLTSAEVRRTGRCAQMALAATRMAVSDARLEPEDMRGPRTSVVLGTTMGEAGLLEEFDHAWIRRGRSGVRPAQLPKYGSTLLPIHVARAVGAEGAVMTLPAACAAGNYAIGLAADLLRANKADVVITGAAEMLQELQYAGFVRLAAMATSRCQPFDLNRQGLILGEGAGVLVLESEKNAVRRGARLLAEVGGHGMTCDAYHITRPHPDAAGSVGAMRQAIERSGLTPNDIDFVNAHGTGTRHNDSAESKVMGDVFGERAVPISSMKSMLGHCMGAASALEAIGCVMTLETGIYPPTIGYETPDPECQVAVVANTARHGKADIVLNNSLAFGGYNSVTCLAKPGKLPAMETRS